MTFSIGVIESDTVSTSNMPQLPLCKNFKIQSQLLFCKVSFQNFKIVTALREFQNSESTSFFSKWVFKISKSLPLCEISKFRVNFFFCQMSVQNFKIVAALRDFEIQSQLFFCQMSLSKFHNRCHFALISKFRVNFFFAKWVFKISKSLPLCENFEIQSQLLFCQVSFVPKLPNWKMDTIYSFKMARSYY